MSTNLRRVRIKVFGNFGTGNLGNECTLQAMLHNIRRYLPNAEIGCICTGPYETAATYNIATFPIRERSLPQISSPALRLMRRVVVGIPLEIYRCFRSISTMKNTDMLIMTGTGMLGDFGILPLGLHYDIVRWSIIARLCKCKLLFVSVGVGPIQHPLSKCFVKAALFLAQYRSYRDSFSREYLDAMGFKTTRDRVYPDLAFSLPRTLIPTGHNRNGQGPVVGVGIMTYYNRRASNERDETVYRAYITKVASFVTWLLQHDYKVRLLIGDIVWDKQVRHDLRALLEKRGLSYGGGEIIDEPASSFNEVLSQLGKTDIVVATRFHNVLLALMVTKLVVAISYHEKIDALMAGAGLAEFCQDIEKIDVNKLIVQLTALENNAGTFKPQIDRTVENYRKALGEQYDHIFTCV